MITTLLILTLLSAPSIQSLLDAKDWTAAEALLPSLPEQTRPLAEGMIAQGKGESARAARAFERALALSPERPVLHLRLAYAYLRLKKFEDALRHVQAAKGLGSIVTTLPLLEARALDGLGRDSEAYRVLNRGCDAENTSIKVCLELALFARKRLLVSEVRTTVQKILAMQPDTDELKLVFNLLADDQESLLVLEQIVFRFPDLPALRGLLGYVYAGHRLWHSAAYHFEQAWAQGEPYAFQAAEQYRMAGRYRDALRMNGMVSDDGRRAIQRLSILFEQKKYAQITVIHGTFEDLGSQYRLAYAHYAIGDYATAQRYAKALQNTDYEEEATVLLRAIGDVSL